MPSVRRARRVVPQESRRRRAVSAQLARGLLGVTGMTSILDTTGLVSEVRRALGSVIDPEVGIDIVSLGLVYAIDATGGAVSVQMTMTTPACPLGEHLVLDAKRCIQELPGVQSVEVELVWEPPWEPTRMSPEVRARFGWAP